MAFSRDKSIQSQNAGTTAASLLSTFVGSSDVDVDADEFLQVFDSFRKHVLDGTVEAAGGESPSSDTATQAPTSSGGNFSDPGDVVFNGGKHKGKTIAQVFAEEQDSGAGNRNYIQWVSDKSNNDFLKTRATEFLASR